MKQIKDNDHYNISDSILRVEIQGDIKKEYARRYLANHLDLIMSNIFLVANISCPGCLDLFNAYYNKEKNIYKLDFCNYPFDEAWYVSKELLGWPYIRKIPLSEVAKWFDQLEIGIKQIASTRVEKTLFALLHFCKESAKISPNSIIWLMHALEAFYNTPRRGIKQALRDSIMRELSTPKHREEEISKIIHMLYKKRSNYVHGTSNIHHPLCNDIFDKRLNDYNSDIIKSYGIASAIVVSGIL